MKILRVKLEDQRVLEALLAAKQKIKAIKRLRDLTAAGLKECKDAIDQLAGSVLVNPSAVIQNPWVIESVRMVSPTGKHLELSMKELELNFLQESNNIGLNEVAELLDLTDFIKNWQLRHHKKDGDVK